MFMVPICVQQIQENDKPGNVMEIHKIRNCPGKYMRKSH